MARQTNRVVENRNLELIGNTAGTFSNTGGYMGVDGINNLIQEKNYPSFIDNITRMVQQQNQLGPDEFGSYVIPPSDPTYSTGQQYARSIAGGMPMSQVIAPGVSYSPEQPGGYTQADLNIAAGITPPPPVYKEPDDPSFFGTGIGGVTIPGGRRDKMPPLRNIFGDMPTTVPPVQVPPQEFDIGNLDIEQIRQDIADSGIDFTNLFGLPQAPDLSQFVTKNDLPNGRDFSVDQLDLPDFNEFALRKDLPVYQEPDLSQFVTKQDLPSFNPQNYRDDFLSIAREGIEIPEYKAPDLSGFARIEDLPTFNPDELRQDILMSLPEQKMQDLSGFMTQDDINKAIAGIDIPSYQAPDLSAYDTRLAELEQSLASLQQPTGGRFSINQPQVRGLF
ncbi:hypothetical protein N9064_01045 [bacterium]|nr:hypothetical protein [bacterium]